MRLPTICLAACFTFACSCDDGGGGGGSGDSANPRFRIIAPLGGATLAGPLFFAVAPDADAQIDAVEFAAGELALGVDEDPADGFRALLDTDDLDVGAQTLSAVAIHADGTETRASVEIIVTRDRPSELTVGEAGAVLGVTEANGATSTLTIPPGVGVGANVRFEAWTQQDVLDRVGVDYDAMGVTFLGAQQIESDIALADVGISSGGFAPQVQPGQAVVNYVISPDLDGDGVGELVATNTATAAPNGDVVADPIPPVSVFEVVTVGRAGAAGPFAPTDPIRGPFGTFLRLGVSGFNHYSLFGNVAEFRSEVDNSVIAVPGVVLPDVTASAASGAQTFFVMVPELPVGGASLVLHALGSGAETPPIQLTILESAATERAPKAVLAELIDAQRAQADTVFALLDSPPPGLVTAREQLNDALDAALAAIEAGTDAQFADAALAIENSGALRVDLYSPFAIETKDAILGGLGAFAAGLASWNTLEGIFARKAGEQLVTGIMRQVLLRYFVYFAASMAFVGMAVVLGIALGGLFSALTGMGSAVPSGGTAAGAVVPAGNDGRKLGVVPGRYLVTLFSGAGPMGFRGLTDAGGYFSLPIVPEGEPYVAIATDTATGEVRLTRGSGPAVGDVGFLMVDFGAPQDEAIPALVPGEYVERVARGDEPASLATFSGAAGQTIGFAYAVSTEEAPSAALRFTVVGPNGDVVASVTGWTGDERIVDYVGGIVLPTDGTYILAVKNLLQDEEPFEYRYELALVPDVAAIASEITLGARHADTLDPPDRPAVHTFEGAADTPVGGVFAWSRAGASDLTNMHLLLQAPTGETLSRDFAVAEHAAVVYQSAGDLPTDGVYTVALLPNDTQEALPFEYRLAYTAFPPGPPLASALELGVAHAEAGVGPVDFRMHTFTGVAGTAPGGLLTWSREGDVPFDDRCLHLTLIGPDGVAVGDVRSADFTRECLDNTEAASAFTLDPLEADGTYTLLVHALAATFDYELRLEAP